MPWVLRAVAAIVVLAAGMGNAQAPAQNLALVIGASDYGRDRAAQEAAGFIVPPALANAVRDSELIASALESKGFTVTRVINPDKRALLSAMNTFAGALNSAGPDAVGVFYFAGHGAQGRPALERDIDNYLIPLGADLATEVDLESEALALSRVSAALKPGPRGAVVLILDACRDFALPAVSRSGMVTRGLAEARAAPGTYIAYATAPGFTALDALPGQQNGPYATALSAEVRAAQGSNIEQVFIAVRNKVLDQTRSTQVPWENSSLRRSVVVGVAPQPARGTDTSEYATTFAASVALLSQRNFADGLQSFDTTTVSASAIESMRERINATGAAGAASLGDVAVDYDVIIQPGHYGRSTGLVGSSGELVTERALVAYVASEVTAILRRRGLSVATIPADGYPRDNPETTAYDGLKSKIFLAIHADGSANCSSQSSVSFGAGSSMLAAHALGWGMARGLGYPHEDFRRDNFTIREAAYYSFSHIRAPLFKGVLQLGAINCPASERLIVGSASVIASNVAWALESAVKQQDR